MPWPTTSSCQRSVGNRNFEGRISPDVSQNYLMQPANVIAYAIAGTMDIDLEKDPLGADAEGNPVFYADIVPAADEVARSCGRVCDGRLVRAGRRRHV